MSEPSNRLIRLRCQTQHNIWGKCGNESLARKLALSGSPENSSVRGGQPYAELWMGTHPTLPSQDYVTNRPLLEILETNPHLLSERISHRFGNDLPFLFKVLSINKALSIQAHPDKVLAKKLHAIDNENYPDENHKPEMVIALTEFETLCGFRPVAELSDLLFRIGAFQQLVGDEATQAVHLAAKMRKGKDAEVAIRNAFVAVLTADSRRVKTYARQLVEFAKSFKEKRIQTTGYMSSDLAELVVRLHEEHPDDVGLFIMFFMNHVKLEPGEALFIESSELHAYLRGDVIECMASSNNIIRAGFTHKIKDIEHLIPLLNFSDQLPRKISPMPDNEVKISDLGSPLASTCVIYQPPVEEYVAGRIHLDHKGAQATFGPTRGPSIVICEQGKGTIEVDGSLENIDLGFVFFLGDGAVVKLENTRNERFVLYRAFCPIGRI